jgi:hypothetical protein
MVAPFHVAILMACGGRESRLDQQLDLAQIAESRNHPAIARRIRAREQQAAGGNELALEPHVMLQLPGVPRSAFRRH